MKIKTTIIIATVLTVFIAGVASWQLQDDYHNWRIAKFIDAAEESLQQGDAYSLDLATKTLLEKYPERLETLQFFARLSDVQGDAAAAYWRKRILELHPELDKERLALGLTYLRLKKFETVDQLLKTWPSTKEKNIPYLKLKGAFAFATQDGAGLQYAETLYALEPSPAHLLNLGKAELLSKDNDVRQRGEARLLEAEADARYGSEASRALVQYFIRNQRFEEARQHASQAWKIEALSWDTRFALLEAASMLSMPELETWRQEMETIVIEKQRMKIRYGAWLLAYVGAQAAVQWFENQFHEHQRSQYPDALPYSEALMQLNATSAIINLLKDADWRNRDYLRTAILARAAMTQEVAGSWWKSTWQKALIEAEKAPGGLDSLAHVLKLWGWRDFELEVLKKIRSRSPQDFPTYLRLNYLLETAGDEAGLLENARLEWRAFPQNFFAKNNFLYLSVLLGQQTPETVQWAQENADAFPGNAFFRATYAYALLESSPEDALALMQELQAAALQSPGLAITWAIILWENGQLEAAREIALATGDKGLLPTQRNLRGKILK